LRKARALEPVDWPLQPIWHAHRSRVCYWCWSTLVSGKRNVTLRGSYFHSVFFSDPRVNLPIFFRLVPQVVHLKHSTCRFLSLIRTKTPLNTKKIKLIPARESPRLSGLVCSLHNETLAISTNVWIMTSRVGLRLGVWGLNTFEQWVLGWQIWRWLDWWFLGGRAVGRHTDRNTLRKSPLNSDTTLKITMKR